VYLREAIYEPERIVAAARALLVDVEYDTLIGTGLSGALILPMLARELGKQFAVVRKPDNSHSDTRVEGSIGNRWVFVDDLIDSGATFVRVATEVRNITREYSHRSELVGAFLYCAKVYRDAAFLRSHYMVETV